MYIRLSIISLFKNLDMYLLHLLLLRVHISSHIVFGILQLCTEEENTRTFLCTNLYILVELVVETERDCLKNCKEHGHSEYILLAMPLTNYIRLYKC
jgi:hypothetical protein